VTTDWILQITVTSTTEPTFNSGSYSIGDSEESGAWAQLDGPTGWAYGLSKTTLTSAYDYEPGGPTDSPDYGSANFSNSSISGLTWTNPSGNTWVGTFRVTETTSYGDAVISRTYSGSSGDGGDGDTTITMNGTWTINVTTY